MKTKKQTQKASQQKPAVNATPVDNKQQETASPQAATVTPPTASPEPLAPPVVSTPPAPTGTSKDEKPKPPSISTVVRKLVILNPDKSADEVCQLLIDTGWDAADVEKRKSTIATLRIDALAILKIAKECGWEKK